MSLIIQIFASLLVLELVQSLNVLPKQEKPYAGKKGNRLGGVLDSLISAKISLMKNDKNFDPIQMAEARKVLLNNNIERRKSGEFIRLVTENTKHAGIEERELLAIKSKQHSAFIERTHVEKNGPNDFLVMEGPAADPFVTVMPNNIYYNIEKKCVNWLDDCSIQGIRARLLEKVRSPYK